MKVQALVEPERIGEIKTVIRAPLADFWPLVNRESAKGFDYAVKRAVEDYLLLTGDGLILEETRERTGSYRPTYPATCQVRCQRRVAKIDDGEIHVYDEVLEGWVPNN